MKILRSFLGSMHAVTIVLLLLLVAAASYNLGAFPASLAAAIAMCGIFDVLIQRLFLKRDFRFPYSGLITGTIIGSIAPLNAPLSAILAAAAVAIASKYAIRIKQRHVFNPATLGLLIALFAFRLGDVWWAASGFNFAGFALPVAFLLIIACFKAGKLKVAIPFLVITAVLYAATQFVSVPLTAASLLNFFTSMPYYFAFIMLSEPKTSPYAAKEQIIFGIAVAVLYFALDFNSVRFPFFIALLAGNLAYSLYRGGLFSQKKQQQNQSKTD